VLFDIDGTLQRDFGTARDAFGAALREVFDFAPDLDGYDFSGLTDPAIVTKILGDGGFDEEQTNPRLEKLWDTYVGHLERLIRPERVVVMPGITQLLDALDSDESVSLGLLTGNIELGARIKLSAHDLNRYLAFGAFGSDSSRREELPPFARDRAISNGREAPSFADTIIIGDSIHDVRCGKPHGAVSIAVATGVTSRERLLDEDPDHFFETLEDTDAVLESIFAA